MSAPGSDRAIVSITKWARREEWRERLELIIDAHFGPVLAAVDLPADDLPEVLGDAFPGLFGCVLEDFVTCNFGPDERSIVEDYIKRRGFKERAPVKSYLRALKRSVMSAYEIVEIAPGSHLVLRDLIRDGAPVRVEDQRGAHGPAPADHIAARLLPINGRTYLSSGVLCLRAEEVQSLVEDARHLRRKFRRGVTREAKQRGIAVADLEAIIPLDDVLLGELAPVFTHIWLTGALEELLGLELTHTGALAGRNGDADPAEAMLTTPLPALAGKSPRQAVRSRDGRHRVAQWLKYRESQDHGERAAIGAAPGDLGWMWQALGIQHLR